MLALEKRKRDSASLGEAGKVGRMAEKTSACPHASSCELYGKFRLKGALKIWQIRYCDNQDRYPTCQRYILSKTGEPVPASLLPNGDSIPV